MKNANSYGPCAGVLIICVSLQQLSAKIQNIQLLFLSYFRDKYTYSMTLYKRVARLYGTPEGNFLSDMYQKRK